MKDQERVKSILSEIEYGYIGYDNLHGDDGHGLKMIKEALEKHVLIKKPLAAADFNGNNFYICPNCSQVVGDYIGYKAKYCFDCGQAIDWSEVEE